MDLLYYAWGSRGIRGCCDILWNILVELVRYCPQLLGYLLSHEISEVVLCLALSSLGCCRSRVLILFDVVKICIARTSFQGCVLSAVIWTEHGLSGPSPSPDSGTQTTTTRARVRASVSSSTSIWGFAFFSSSLLNVPWLRFCPRYVSMAGFL
ncbi:unnamed protein product [Prunus armeniaca]